MLSPKQSLQQYNQKLAIEKTMGERYGYHLQSNRYELPKVKEKQRKQKVSINDSITPLIVKQKQIEQSQRLRELNKQIEQLEIQKKINKMSIRQQQQSSDNLNVNDLINVKIKQYNYLVDHKHLIKRKPAKSLFINISQNNANNRYGQQSENVLDVIKKKQKELNQTGNLMHKYKRNQHIASLYREYSASMRLDEKPKIQSMTSPINRKITATQMKIAVKLKQNQKVKQLSNRGRQQSKFIDLDDIYADKKFMDSSKQINEGVRRNKKMSLIMKEKLEAIRLKRQKEQEEKSQIIKSDLNIQQMKTSVSDFSLEYLKLSSKISFKQEQEELKQQKSYLSLALQKRSPRYIKQQGSKFVSKFDPDQAAQQMIVGPKKDEDKNKRKKIDLKSNIRKIKIPVDLSPQDKMVMGFMVQQESDAYYWTTCRNQKVNLMLKGRKHS